MNFILNNITKVFSQLGIFPNSEMKLLAVKNAEIYTLYDEITINISRYQDYILRNGFYPINIVMRKYNILIYKNLHGQIHRFNKPAKISYSNDKIVESEIYYENGKKHRINEPAEINYFSGENHLKFNDVYYYEHGLLHREDGPAVISFTIDDYRIHRIYLEIYYRDGIVHRENKPAVISYNITDSGKYYISGESYYRDGKVHRNKNEPAEINYSIDENEKYYISGESYYRNGKLHRNTKPASFDRTINSDGSVGDIYYKKYSRNGKLFRKNDLPSEIRYFIKEEGIRGNVSSESWFKNNSLNRQNAPAEIFYYNHENGNHCISSMSFFKRGKLHRKDGPAMICYYVSDDGIQGKIKTSKYFINGKEIDFEPNSSRKI